MMIEFDIEKVWKCPVEGTGGIFIANPKGLEDCSNCAQCLAEKGLGVVGADFYIFIGESRIKKVLE